MKLTYKTSVLAAATTLALAACSFGPSGEPPVMPSSAHYGAQAQPSKTVVADGVAQQFDIGSTAIPQWWRLYRSDALDALVEEGLRNSPTLAATQRTLSAAQEELRGQIGSSTLPSVDAAAQVERARSPVAPGIGPTEVRYNFFAGQIQTHYTFDLFGATRYSNAAAAARVNVQGYELEAARRALAANIVGTAINVAALDRQIALTERLVAVAIGDEAGRCELLVGPGRSDNPGAGQFGDLHAGGADAAAGRVDQCRLACLELANFDERFPGRRERNLRRYRLRVGERIGQVHRIVGAHFHELSIRTPRRDAQDAGAKTHVLASSDAIAAGPAIQ